MKKLFSFLLAIVIAMPLSVNALASENIDTKIDSKYLPIHQEKIKSITGDYKKDILVKIITDISGNSFELIETGVSGYYIFDADSGKYIEYSTDAPSPYLGISGELKYFGPKNYYVNTNGSFEHTIVDEVLDVKIINILQENFGEMIETSREIKDISVLSLLNEEDIKKLTLSDAFISRASNEYINNYTYIKNAIYPANLGETCGYVAACLVMNYWNKVYSGNVIPSEYLNSSGNLKTTGYTLQDKLLDYGYGSATWALDIRDALIDFCNEYGIGAYSAYYIGKIGAVSELGNNHPVILFGYLPDESTGSGKIKHAVTAYGVRNETLVSYFIVHYGWTNYNEIVLDSGLIGSNTQFELR